MVYLLKKRSKIEFLSEASKILSSSLDYNVTLASIAKLMVDNIADICVIDLFNNKGVLERVAARTSSIKNRQLTRQFLNFPADPKNKKAIYDAARTGRPILIKKITENWLKTASRIPQERKVVKKLGMNSFIFVPLKSIDGVIGVLTLASSKKDFSYTESDVLLAQEVANRAGVAVDKARKFAYVQRDSRQKLYLLSETSRILSSSLDYNVTLASIATLVVRNIADFCMIDLLEKDGKLYRVATRVGDSTKRGLANKMFDYPADPRNKGGVYDTARTGRPILVKKITENWLNASSRIPEEKEITKKLGMESFMFVPLKSRGEVIGVLTIVSSRKGFSYSEDDLLLAQEIADRAGVAVDKARIYAQAQEALEKEKALASNLRFLSDASKILSSSLDYKTTLRNVAKLSVYRIADWCGVDMLNEDGQLEQVVVVHKDPEKVKWARQLRKERPVDLKDKTGIANVLKTGKAELYPFITDEMLAQSAKSEEELELLRKLNLSSAMIVPICSDKKCIGTISFLTDTSRRRFDENSLRAAVEPADRASIAIENARLYQVAQDAIRNREAFMAIAAHELRTPLTIILLHIQKANTDIKKLMEKHTGMEKIPELLEKSEKQGFRLAKLINDLLDVSLATTGKLSLHRERVDLNVLVEEALQLFSIQLKKVKPFIVYDRSSEPVIGYWDRVRLEQVISNLLSNALKYGKAKPVNILVRKEGQEAVIKVKDQGIGVKPQHRKKIFELFKRGVSTSDYTGIGIGLYISERIVEAHGGTIEVDSKEGIGSTFTIRLPLKSH